MSTSERSLGEHSGKKKNTGTVKGKNNPRATIVEGVDTREPRCKRRTTKLVVWVETTQKSTGYCAVVVAAVVVRYGLRRAVYKSMRVAPFSPSFAAARQTHATLE